MRCRSERAWVQLLRANGLNASQIATRTGIPRSTVRGWLSPPRADARKRPDWTPQDAPADAYAYLLGVYLGDGCVVRGGRETYRLVITNDARYSAVSLEIADAIGRVLPHNRVAITPHPTHRCVTIGAYSKHWPRIFPQHGPGRKHLRRIDLEPWQRSITHHHPELFVRGLMHSDGCRFLARQRRHGKIYTYVRYSFSNRSDDIKALLCEHLDVLGVAWTRPNAKDIQIARRSSVEVLERIVGPKA